MTTLSGSPLYFMKGFDDYVSSHAAHDQDRPGGPSARVEYMSCVGDCAPETFVGDVRRTALSYGKGELEVDAYSYVLSHSHEELDPTDGELGVVAHDLAREWVVEAFPGRQAKIVTQRDNGRWEGEGDDRQWVEGHWHSHIIVANVAEQAVELRWADAKGTEKTKHYRAGRAVDGDLKNIFRLRHVTDAVVLREWRYDNAAYVEACRQSRSSEGQTNPSGLRWTGADGSGGDDPNGGAAKRDLAQRAERGYSSYDEVRLKLRTAAAQSTSWGDYTTRCQAAAVDVKTRGKSGVSYAWVGDDGLERKARARGKTGIGPAFTRAEIEARCEQNVAALARGEALEIPEQVLVAPSTTVAPDRPRPQYLTEDGLPPWENAEALVAYERRVQAAGGTYEDRAGRALVTGEPVEGVELAREDRVVVAEVDAGDGPVRFDVDAALAERVREIEATQAAVVADRAEIRERLVAIREGLEAVESQKAGLQQSIDEIGAMREQAVAEGYEVGRAEALAAVEDEKQRGYTEGRAEGNAAGRNVLKIEFDLKEERLESREAAVEKWETETAPALRAEIRAEIESAMQDDRDAAATARTEAMQARDEAQRRRDAIPVYDPVAAVQAMEVARFDAGETLQIVQRDDGGVIVRDEAGKPVMVKVNAELDRESALLYRGGTVEAGTTVADRARGFKDVLRGGQNEIAKSAERNKQLGQEDLEHEGRIR